MSLWRRDDEPRAAGLRAVGQRDDPYVHGRSELQVEMMPPAYGGADAYRTYAQFDTARRVQRH